MADKKADKKSAPRDKADKNTDQAEDPKQAKKAGGGGLIQAAILALGAGLTAFVTVFLMPSAPPPVASCVGADGQAFDAALGDTHAPPPKPIETTLVPLDEILISIGHNETRRYLKINLTLIMDKNRASEMGDLEPQLRDAFSTYLRAVEITDFEDPAFYEILRRQLHRRAQLIIGPRAVESILITDFLLR